MRAIAFLVLFSFCACSKQGDTKTAQPASKVATVSSTPAAQSMIGGKTMAAMHLIPIPKDKAQLDRLLSMGYTVHQDHMHPPGVKECPLDKHGGSVIE